MNFIFRFVYISYHKFIYTQPNNNSNCQEKNPPVFAQHENTINCSRVDLLLKFDLSDVCVFDDI